VEKPAYSAKDLLVLGYYLILQDRLEEASRMLAKIGEEGRTEVQLQYDYFASYLDLNNGFPDFLTARRLCEKYLDYPVISWRNYFYDIANLLAEFDGE